MVRTIHVMALPRLVLGSVVRVTCLNARSPTQMADPISRFSSCNQRFNHVFIKDRLKEAKTYVFRVVYGDFLNINGGDRSWELWTKVVARRGLEEHLKPPWSLRSGSIS